MAQQLLCQFGKAITAKSLGDVARLVVHLAKVLLDIGHADTNGKVFKHAFIIGGIADYTGHPCDC